MSPPRQARNLYSGTLADDAPPPVPPFYEVETHFINKSEFMGNCSCIELRNSLTQRTQLHQK